MGKSNRRQWPNVIDVRQQDDRRAATTYVGDLGGFQHAHGSSNVRSPPLLGLGHLYVPVFAPGLPNVALIERMGDVQGFRLALHHPEGVALDGRWLQRLVCAVSFVLGAPSHVPLFVGTDSEGRSAGARGSDFGMRRPFGSPPGRPLPVGQGCWAVPFLRRLLALLHDRPDVPELDLALEYYLDSYDDPVDAAYLKLVVVLEGLAQHVLRERGSAVGVVHRTGKRPRLSLVTDHDAWINFARELTASMEFKSWQAHVETKRKELTGLLLPVLPGTKDWTDTFVGRLVPNSFAEADELSAGQRVLAALLALGARPDKRMKDECREWHAARHTGVAPGGRDAVDERLWVLRSMLVLMLARWSGYTGPTLGHVPGKGPLSTAISGVEPDAEQRAEALASYVDRPT